MRICAAWIGAWRAGIVTTDFREFLFSTTLVNKGSQYTRTGETSPTKKQPSETLLRLRV